MSEDLRQQELQRFYATMDLLRVRNGDERRLSEVSGRTDWPTRGVYFFFEAGEQRSHSGNGLRVVRVGTHALKAGSNTTLWNRLAQHKGQAKTRGGNHRGSIFRLLVGNALMQRDGLSCPTWGRGSSASREVRQGEQWLETAVSAVIGGMPFLWLGIEDQPGPDSLRGYIERNAIALLSNYGKELLDPPAPTWLGRQCQRPRVRLSGLWNQNHVEDTCDPAFLSVLEDVVLQGSRIA